jgi:hypothetical protein
MPGLLAVQAGRPPRHDDSKMSRPNSPNDKFRRSQRQQRERSPLRELFFSLDCRVGGSCYLMLAIKKKKNYNDMVIDTVVLMNACVPWSCVQ